MVVTRRLKTASQFHTMFHLLLETDATTTLVHSRFSLFRTEADVNVTPHTHHSAE